MAAPSDASPPPIPAASRPADADADAPTDADATGSGFSPTALAVLVLLVAAFAALVLLVHPLHDAAISAAHGRTGELRSQLRGLGVGGVLVLFCVVLGHAVIPYPAEIPLAAAGFVYGFWGALPLSLAMWTVSACVTYAMGRYAGRPLLYRLAGAKRFHQAERTVEKGGIPVLLAARLVPIVPFSLIGYVAGATRVRLRTFAWTTLVGFLPLSTIVTLLGSRLKSLNASDPVLYIALAPVLVLLAIAHPLARKLRENA